MMQLHHGSIAEVLICIRLTETLITSSGVAQGDIFSPYIFILLVHYILRQLLVDEAGPTLKPANGHRHQALTLTALVQGVQDKFDSYIRENKKVLGNYNIS